MVKEYTHIRVQIEDKEKLMNECIALFLSKNPEFEGANITQDFMFRRLVKVYLNEL